jgi:hypothetical protein
MMGMKEREKLKWKEYLQKRMLWGMMEEEDG